MSGLQTRSQRERRGRSLRCLAVPAAAAAAAPEMRPPGSLTRSGSLHPGLGVSLTPAHTPHFPSLSAAVEALKLIVHDYNMAAATDVRTVATHSLQCSKQGLARASRYAQVAANWCKATYAALSLHFNRWYDAEPLAMRMTPLSSHLPCAPQPPTLRSATKLGCKGDAPQSQTSQVRQ